MIALHCDVLSWSVTRLNWLIGYWTGVTCRVVGGVVRLWRIAMRGMKGSGLMGILRVMRCVWTLLMSFISVVGVMCGLTYLMR